MTPLVRTLRDLESTATQSVPWLWPGRIAPGRLTLLDGDPAVGKSLVTLDLAARVSSGREFPDGHRPAEPAAVLVLSAEDGVQDTVLPRLRGAGADLNRVHALDTRATPLFFPESCSLLQEYIEQTRARLVILDPFFAFLGAEISSLNEMMTRRALDPLMRVAETTQAALLLVRHLRKNHTGCEMAYRGLGSVAIVGAARTAQVVGTDPKNHRRRVLACTKSNLGTLPASLGFVIGQTDSGEARLEWHGAVPLAADDLLEAGRRRGPVVSEAAQFLRSCLRQGPRQRHAVLEEAEQAGISFRTLERAKGRLGVVSRQRREGGRNVWYWQLDSR